MNKIDKIKRIRVVEALQTGTDEERPKDKNNKDYVVGYQIS